MSGRPQKMDRGYREAVVGKRTSSDRVMNLGRKRPRKQHGEKVGKSKERVGRGSGQVIIGKK